MLNAYGVEFQQNWQFEIYRGLMQNKLIGEHMLLKKIHRVIEGSRK